MLIPGHPGLVTWQFPYRGSNPARTLTLKDRVQYLRAATLAMQVLVRTGKEELAR